MTDLAHESVAPSYIRRARPLARPKILDVARAADTRVTEAMKAAHISIDGYGRILGMSLDVERRLGFGKRLVGRWLVDRVVAPQRAGLARSLVDLRRCGRIAPMELVLRRQCGGTEVAALIPVVIAHVGSESVVILEVAFSEDGAPEGRLAPLDADDGQQPQ